VNTQQYDDELREALFRNDKKERDTHPGYKGSAQINGTEYWISAWINTAKSGQKYMALSFTAKDPPDDQPPQQTVSNADDDIPF
jgi:hypothetical protein